MRSDRVEPDGPTLVGRVVPTGGLKAAIQRGVPQRAQASDERCQNCSAVGTHAHRRRDRQQLLHQRVYLLGLDLLGLAIDAGRGTGSTRDQQRPHQNAR